MRGGPLRALVASAVLAVVALAVAYPERMVSPGALIAAHAGIEKDCFACHAPWRGAASERCTRCHRRADIGLRTTRGVALTQAALRVSFHQELIERDCLACHSDHPGAKLAERSRQAFSHSMLRPQARPLCEGCHIAPADPIHRDLSAACGRCHGPDRWKPATFDHALLTKAVQDRCAQCHQRPADSLHRPLKQDCGPCHSPQHWKPSTFDHASLFELDSNHNAPCATCHSGDDIRRYTCYGCHEHRPAPIRTRHLEAGIRNFDDCARCHRNPGAEPQGGDN